MKQRQSLLCVLLLCACCTSQATVTEFSLDNGLKLLVKEDHRAPVVVSQVWYKVGSSYEHDGITGISHVLEHMMFKGTEKFPPGEFSRIIAANGGTENAFTGADYTGYYQTLEKSRLPISFELEADRMRNLILAEEAFSKEIEVVKEERRMRTEDQPTAYLYEVAMATAYQTSPYRQPVVGWMADLDRLQLSALEAWYRKWYAPDNATIVVAGDVDPQAVHALAIKYFAGLPPAAVSSGSPLPEIPQLGIKRVTVKRPAQVPFLLMAYKVPVLKTAIENSQDNIEAWEMYALDVLVGVLDGGSSARFASRLIRGREVAASAGAGYNMASRMDGLVTFSGTPAQGKTVADLEQAVREEITALQTTLITNDELVRVKAQVVAQDVYEKDSVFYQAMILGVLETAGLPWEIADEYVSRIQAVTPGQVALVAQKYLVDDSLTVANLEPQPMEQQTHRPASGEGHAH